MSKVTVLLMTAPVNKKNLTEELMILLENIILFIVEQKILELLGGRTKKKCKKNIGLVGII